MLANGITAVTELPVHFIKHEVDDDGVIREVPWSPVAAARPLVSLGKFALAGTPLLGGLAVGVLHSSTSSAALIGVVLWLVQTAIVLISSPRSRRSKLSYLYWSTTAITFAASYAAVFLITANALGAR